MSKEMEVKAFLAVCRHLSFTKAADSLFLSQQACSRYIRNLEESVGFPLLERTTRNVTVTPEGELLFQVLSEANQNYENIVRIGRSQAGSKKHTVRIGVMNMTSIDFLAEPYHLFQQQYPDVNVIWAYEDPGYLKTQLQEDRIDLAIMHLQDEMEQSVGPEYRTMKLKSCNMYLKYSRFHPLAESAACPADFDTAIVGSFIHFSRSVSEEIFRMKRRLENFGLRNNVVQVFGSLEEMDISIQLGEVIGLASELSLFFRGVETKTMRLGEGFPLSCVWKTNTQNPFVRLLVDTLTVDSTGAHRME